MDTAILFDLDGTLLNTLEDLADSTNAALSQLGYPARTLEEVRRFVGNGALRLMEQAVPEGGDALSAYRAFRTYYDAHSQIKTAPYPGILKALAEIQQKHPVAIVSNKPDSMVQTLEQVYYPGVPDMVMGERDGLARKPAPDMVRFALETIGAEAERSIYVGDTEVDILTAKNAGMGCISVPWGFRSRAQLEKAGAKPIADSVEELARYLGL